jgi:hypothetical protein
VIDQVRHLVKVELGSKKRTKNVSEDDETKPGQSHIIIDGYCEPASNFCIVKCLRFWTKRKTFIFYGFFSVV